MRTWIFFCNELNARSASTNTMHLFTVDAMNYSMRVSGTGCTGMQPMTWHLSSLTVYGTENVQYNCWWLQSIVYRLSNLNTRRRSKLQIQFHQRKSETHSSATHTHTYTVAEWLRVLLSEHVYIEYQYLIDLPRINMNRRWFKLMIIIDEHSIGCGENEFRFTSG